VEFNIFFCEWHSHEHYFSKFSDDLNINDFYDSFLFLPFARVYDLERCQFFTPQLRQRTPTCALKGLKID